MKKIGFTLIETLMALTIFSIGILGIISIFPRGIKLNKVSLEDLSFVITSDIVQSKIKKALVLDSSINIYNYFPLFPNSNSDKGDEGVYIDDLDPDNFLTEQNNIKPIKEIKPVSIFKENIIDEKGNIINGLYKIKILIKDINNRQKEFSFYLNL